MNKKILIVFGTRPEFLKLYPLIVELKKKKKVFHILNTGQHNELLKDQRIILDELNLKNFDLKKKTKNLSDSFSLILKYVSNQIIKIAPDIVIVQGDTSTAVASALAAHFNMVKVAHIEAGLRTFDKNNPFPEETNRLLISKLADYHFAPTRLAYQNLIKENIDKKKIFITGNTIVDTIRLLKKKIKITSSNNVFCTIHRRENFGNNFKKICSNINFLSNKYKYLNFIFTVHPNPNIKKNILKYLKLSKNLKIIKPLSFFDSLTMQLSSSAIITDSGGIQEEATTLNKYCIIAREKTERQEAINSKNCYLVGSDLNKFLKYFSIILNKNKKLKVKKILLNKTFGDGHATKKILKILNKNE